MEEKSHAARNKKIKLLWFILMSILGGLICDFGYSLNLFAAGNACLSISYSLGQCATLVAVG